MRISSSRKYAIKETPDHTNYSPDGRTLVPSVTTVLKIIGKESLMQWANSLGWKRKSLNKELNDASVIGTLAHNYIEHLIMDNRAERYNVNVEIDSLPYEMNEKTRNCINSFLAWWKENKEFIVPVAVELSLVGDGYGGTIDFVCYYKGKLVIIDFKTSSDFHPTMYLQGSAYVKMYEENTGKKVHNFGILRMDKKNGNKAKLKFITEVPGGDIDYYYQTFRHALHLYRYMQVIDSDFEE